MSLDPSEIDDLYAAILDYLQDGKDSGGPWGYATPAVIRWHLEEDGFEPLPVRQTVNSRLKDLQHADHVRNIGGKGLYEFVSDPRTETSARD